MGFFENTLNTFKSLFDNTDEFVDISKVKKIKDSTTKELVLNFFNIKKSKSNIIKELDEISDFYFAQLILNRIIEDAFTPQQDGVLFTTTILNNKNEEDEHLTNETKSFLNSVNINKVILDVAFDLLKYGEYALRLDTVEGNGIINIHDDVNLSILTPVYRDSSISYFLTIENKKLISKQPSNYAYFLLPGNRIKVNVEGDNKILHLRMGKSVLYPVLGLLKELKFLEELIPTQFINSLSKSKLVSVTVPPKTKPGEAIEIAKTFEELINSNLKKNSSTPEELLNEIKNTIGKVKVIPNFGDKGQLEEIEFNSENIFDDVFTKVEDIRKNIFTTVGIPTTILDDENTKLNVIKNYIRYNKKLKNIQFAVADGIRNLILIHLQNKGYDISLKNIQVNFSNIFDTDNMEKLEYLDMQISLMSNFASFLSDLENVNYDNSKFIEFLNNNIRQILGFDLFTE